MVAVKSQVDTVKPCLHRAVLAGLLALDEPHHLVLDFTVQPDGSLRDPVVVGPPGLAGTSLAICMKAAMRRWRFPPSRDGGPVRNYPFGPFTIHSPPDRSEPGATRSE